ncbi:MAG TPA: HD domain-containing protein, partial [Nitrosopumilaceae archaeon]|nr:HD domain-containing protein [Nitrosopumilaceae archaeon]
MIEEFFKITANLKKIPRKGWTTKLGITTPESVADHTFSMSIIAMVLADLQKLDTHKVLKMSLLHDIAESAIGDITPDEMLKKEKAELENKTISKILSNLPDDLAKKYLFIWKEYVESETDEAKLVHEVDKLEMVIQGTLYLTKDIKKEKLEP